MRAHLLGGSGKTRTSLLAAEAAALGNVDVIAVIKELVPGGLYYQDTPSRRTAVHGAAINACNNGAAALPVLEAVAGPDHKCLSHQDVDGNTALMLACQGYDGPPDQWAAVADMLMPRELFRRPQLLERVNNDMKSVFQLVKRERVEWLQGVAPACGAERPVPQLDLTQAELGVEQPPAQQQRFALVGARVVCPWHCAIADLRFCCRAPAPKRKAPEGFVPTEVVELQMQLLKKENENLLLKKTNECIAKVSQAEGFMGAVGHIIISTHKAKTPEVSLDSKVRLSWRG